MGSIENHRKKIKEHMEELQDAISIGIYSRPATIGFHTIACSINLLELFLHRRNLIDIGKVVKHDWFKRPNEGQKIDPLIERKLPVSFEDKEKIYDFFYILEENRNNLVYGKSSKAQIDLVMETFQKISKILTEKLRREGERIE